MRHGKIWTSPIEMDDGGSWPHGRDGAARRLRAWREDKPRAWVLRKGHAWQAFNHAGRPAILWAVEDDTEDAE